MNRLILGIYDRFGKNRRLSWGLFLILTVALVVSVSRLSYQEDISDFLPLDERNQTALSVYQDVSGANKIYAIVSVRDTTEVDPEELIEGVEAFARGIEQLDTLGYIKAVTKQIDMDKMMGVADQVYERIPYFLQEKDYLRIDSLLSETNYVERQIAEDKQLLLFPSSHILSANISRDPLNLFSPVLNRLRQAGMSIAFDSYDGYILSPDGKRAIVILESAFGAHESEHNAALVSMLSKAKALAEQEHPAWDIHLIGGPIIAVSNASQIKSDSILAVCIAGILITLLLIYVFRNLRNILLIVVSVAWGWLFAMAAIALLYDSVSIIVIGIASVILGIAVNYPLHLIDHLKDSEHPRSALREIISPLVVGNVTTVGAFLCLVPLSAPALRDLGLFSSLLLMGTIVFVLVLLPHIVRTRAHRSQASEPVLIARLANISLENSKPLVCLILLSTVVLGYFSLKTEFDSDMRNINYMTPEQKSDMSYFQSLVNPQSDTESLYVVSSGTTWQEALAQEGRIASRIDQLVASGAVSRQNEVSAFLVSEDEQAERLRHWSDFVTKYQERLTQELEVSALNQGFSKEAFAPFYDIISAEYEPREFEHFKELVSTVFVGNISEDEHSGRRSLVQVLSVPKGSMDKVKESLTEVKGFDGLLFDVGGMNSSIARTLSDDFNYIGLACSVIVFIFLWISLGRVELAIVSFVPMVFSWIWILGLMSLLGIKFNIVNVILATFIFGQGDDYTIFMTEGLSYELAYRRRLLASYKNSIVVSALIMFIGIGTLLLAEHPALRSLGEVTVVGMLSVVLMAYLFPPLLFNWLVRRGERLRYRPITLGKLICTAFCAVVFLAQLLSAYILGFVLFVLSRSTPQKRALFHRYTCSVFRFDIKRIPGIELIYKNLDEETFDSPAVIICNHQSILDSFCLMAISPKVVLLSNEHIKMNPLVGTIFKWSSFLTIAEGSEGIIDRLKPLIAEGFSVVVFPEGGRPEEGSVHLRRFHRGAFHIAEALGLDIVPVYLSGVAQIMPKGSFCSNGGRMYIEVGARISRCALEVIGDPLAQSKALRTHYTEHLEQIHREVFDLKGLMPIVQDRYIYKGREIETSAQKALRAIAWQERLIRGLEGQEKLFVLDDAGQGELALTLALLYSRAKVYCYLPSPEARAILLGCVQDFVSNVCVLEGLEEGAYEDGKALAVVSELGDPSELVRLHAGEVIRI